MTAPTDYALTIYAGTTFELHLAWKDAAGAAIDLTGYSARMQMRKKQSAADTVFSLASPAAGIVLGGAAGTIDVVLGAAQTGSLSARSGVYDLELVSASGKVTRLLQGAVTVDPEVTRDV
jgi:hypothetical protein